MKGVKSPHSDEKQNSLFKCDHLWAVQYGEIGRGYHVVILLTPFTYLQCLLFFTHTILTGEFKKPFIFYLITISFSIVEQEDR